MKIICLVILIALTILSCTRHGKIESGSNSTDYMGLHFNGNVKLVEYEKMNTENSIVDSGTYEFDEGGYLTEMSFLKEGTYIRKVIRISENIGQPHLYDIAEYIEFENGKLVEKNSWIDSLDSKGNIVQQKAFDLSGRLIIKIIYSYSDLAKLIQKNYTHFESNTVDITEFYYDSTEILRKEVFNKYVDSIPNRGYVKMHNWNGMISAETEYLKYEEFLKKTIYEYDSLMNLRLIRTYGFDSTILHEIEINYDEAGVKIDSVIRNNNGSPIPEESLNNTEIFRFDDRGEITEWILKKGDSTLRSFSYAYSYDSQSLITEKLIIHSDGHKTIKYDRNGMRISEESFDRNGKLEKKESYIMKYDQMGNAIQQKRYLNDTLKEIVNYRIEYY